MISLTTVLEGWLYAVATSYLARSIYNNEQEVVALHTEYLRRRGLKPGDATNDRVVTKSRWLLLINSVFTTGGLLISALFVSIAVIRTYWWWLQ